MGSRVGGVAYPPSASICISNLSEADPSEGSKAQQCQGLLLLAADKGAMSDVTVQARDRPAVQPATAGQTQARHYAQAEGDGWLLPSRSLLPGFGLAPRTWSGWLW